MARPQRKPQAGAPDPRPLVRRTTAMTDAMVAAFQAAGYDTSAARLPAKREPSWRVTRKG